MVAEVTVKTIGKVSPTKRVGGSNEIWASAEMVAKVALLDTTISAALFRYASRLITVTVLAGMVIVARGEGTALVDVAGAAAEVEDGPTTVTRTVTMYRVPLLAD